LLGLEVVHLIVGMVCMACMFGIVCMVGVVIMLHMYVWIPRGELPPPPQPMGGGGEPEDGTIYK
jgi:hypothetical protein